MSDHTAIQWTDATWNPTTGCTKISPGCAHCYIETTPAFRVRHRQFDAKGHIPLQLHDDRLTQPMRWREPRRIFVNSLSDLFHRDIPDDFIDRVFAVMALTPQHTYQVLTKRAPRMRDYMVSRRPPHFTVRMHAILENADNDGSTPVFSWPLPNVWLGVSVENQRLRRRIDYLLETPAAVRFVSAEPLLEDLDLTPYLAGDALAAPGPGGFRKGPKLDWVIVGGEWTRSLADARDCRLEWIDSLVEQCHDAGVACYVKQLGRQPRAADNLYLNLRDKHGGDPAEWRTPYPREFPATA